MSKGVQFLFRKNNIELLRGFGALAGGTEVEVTADDGTKRKYSARNIIIATGARSKELPGLRQDGRKIIGYREAMTLPVQPDSMVVVGSGAIAASLHPFIRRSDKRYSG
jgi:dihydrolipoamide dehydrogenase